MKKKSNYQRKKARPKRKTTGSRKERTTTSNNLSPLKIFGKYNNQIGGTVMSKAECKVLDGIKSSLHKKIGTAIGLSEGETNEDVVSYFWQLNSEMNFEIIAIFSLLHYIAMDLTQTIRQRTLIVIKFVV